MAKVSSSKSLEARVPKLRFPGFEGEWEEKKLSDVATGFDYGMNAAAGDFDGINKYIRITDINEESRCYISDNPVSPKGNLDDKYLVHKNDILFARTGASTGKTYLYKRSDGKLYFAGFLIRISVNNDNNSTFVYNSTLTNKYKRWVQLTSMRSGQPGINSQEYSSYRSYYPQLNEQNKIAFFFEALDRRIEKQRQLVETLKLYKRGVSTALFTRKLQLQKSGNIPYLIWVQKQLGEIFNERTERAVGTEKLLAVTINNGVQERASLDLKDNSSDDKQSYRVVHIGDLAYNTMRMWQGACGVSSYEGIVSPAYTVLYVNNVSENYAPYFGYFFKELSMLHIFQRNSQGLTSDTWNLKYDKFSNITISVPSYEEQLRITSLLDGISREISKQEELLSTLSEYKHGLLSSMLI